MIRRGDLRADKTQYPDGTGCCIWRVFPGHDTGDDEGMGVCWDFPWEELDDIVAMLGELRDAPVDNVYEEPDEAEQQLTTIRDRLSRVWRGLLWKLLCG
jgi:hypothetical protein